MNAANDDNDEHESAPDVAVAAPASSLCFNEKDVLLGRFKFCRENGGNQRLRKLVKDFSLLYEAADKAADYKDKGQKFSKEDINRIIVTTIQVHGGRFLKVVHSKEAEHTKLCARELSDTEATTRVADEFKKVRQRRQKEAAREGVETMGASGDDRDGEPPIQDMSQTAAARPLGILNEATDAQQQDVLSLELSLDSLSKSSSECGWTCQSCSYVNRNSKDCALCGVARNAGSLGQTSVTSDSVDTSPSSAAAALEPKQEVEDEETKSRGVGGAGSLEAASRASLTFSNIFNIISIKPDAAGAKRLLSSLDDNFESVQSLMDTPDSNFEARLQAYGFDWFDVVRLRGFRIWFKRWYLPATEKPLLTKEAWHTFRAARRSGTWRNPPSTTTVDAHVQSHVAISDSNGPLQQGSRVSHQSIDEQQKNVPVSHSAEVADWEKGNARLTEIDTDSQNYEALMMASVLSPDSSHDRLSIDEGNDGKRDRSARSCSSKSNESSGKPPTKKVARPVANHSDELLNKATSSRKKKSPSNQQLFKNPSSLQLAHLSPLLARLACEENGESQRPLELPTITEGRPVGASGNAAAVHAKQSRSKFDSSSAAGSAPLSQVHAGSVEDVSTITLAHSGDFQEEGAAANETKISSLSVPRAEVDRNFSAVSISSQKDFEATLRSTIRKMQDGLKDGEEQIQCFGEVSSLMWAIMDNKNVWGADQRRAQLRVELMECVLCAMKTHTDDLKITEYALKTIEWLCLDADESFVSENYGKIIVQVVESMKIPSNSAATQQSATLLSTLAVDKQSCQAIIEADGVHQVVVAMQKNLSLAEVQETGCLLLLKLSGCYEFRKAIPSEHVVPVVLRMMQRYTYIEDLQEHGCTLLARFYRSSESILIDSECVSAVVAAMQHHKSRVQLLKRACCLFGSLVIEDEDSLRLIVAASGIPTVVSSMQQNKNHTEVQVEGCRALSTFAYNGGADVCRQIAAAGGITVIAGAMEPHASNEDVQKYSCWAFRNLAEGDDSSCRSQIQDESVIKLVQHAKANFPSLASDVKGVLRLMGGKVRSQRRKRNQTESGT